MLRHPTDSRLNEAVTFFYLDAHWYGDIPPRDERAGEQKWSRFVAMIDDFEVPGDAGYGFDDHGPGRALTLEYIRPVVSECSLPCSSLPVPRPRIQVGAEDAP